MNSQEKSFERTRQKQRTRAELLRAAKELTEKGLQPSVAEVADHAGISRATAYRYFSTPEDLVREAVLDAVAKNIRVEPGEAGRNDGSAEDRLLHVVKQVFDMVTDNEMMFRALLSSSVGGKAPARRGGRRMDWLEKALEPLKGELPAADFQRLVYGLSLVTGIETLVVMKDVCGLDNAKAEDATQWVARTLLAGAMQKART